MEENIFMLGILVVLSIGAYMDYQADTTTSKTDKPHSPKIKKRTTTALIVLYGIISLFVLLCMIKT